MRFLIIAFMLTLGISLTAQVMEYDNYSVAVTPLPGDDTLFTVSIVDLGPKGKFIPAFSGSRFDSLTAQQLEVLLYELADQQAVAEAKAKYELISVDVSSKRMRDGLKSLGATRFDSYLTVNHTKNFTGAFDVMSDAGDSLRVEVNEQLEIKNTGGKTIGVIDLTSSRSANITPVGADLKTILGGSDVSFYFGPGGELTAWTPEQKLVILRRSK